MSIDLRHLAMGGALAALPMVTFAQPQLDCGAYYRLQTGGGEAEAWCNAGSTFTYDGLDIFYVCMGDPADPFIYMNHGWPTSSHDFEPIMSALASDYRVCALDTPGYGFSDKPATGYTYSIAADAPIVEHFLTQVVGRPEVILLTHDKGDSVGLELLDRYLSTRAAGGDPGFRLTHHFLLNGSIYLGEADLSGLQYALLDPQTGPPLADTLTGTMMAAAVGGALYTPDLRVLERQALASIFDFQDGTGVMDQTIQYLNERMSEEGRWLDALAASDVPTTLIWGELDTVANTDVADYAWCRSLAHRTASASYWRLPAGDHYVQHDRPGEVVGIIRDALGGPGYVPPAGDLEAAYLYATSGVDSFCN